MGSKSYSKVEDLRCRPSADGVAKLFQRDSDGLWRFQSTGRGASAASAASSSRRVPLTHFTRLLAFLFRFNPFQDFVSAKAASLRLAGILNGIDDCWDPAVARASNSP